jgi:hypothetical protein
VADQHKNFAYSTVLTAPSPATSGTSLVVQTGDGSKFPTPPFNATVWPANKQPLSSNAEIVRVTAVSTDTLTIARAQESTTARTIVAGDQIAATVTAKTLTDIETEATTNATTSAPGRVQLANDLGGTATSPTVKSRLVTKTVGPSGTSSDYVTDGAADDVEIQAAINAVGAAGGGRVHLRAGTYNILATITILYNNITITGEGAATKLYLSSAANCTIFKVGDASTVYSNVNFRDIQMDGNQANQSVSSLFGIWFAKCNHCTVDNVVGNNFVTYALNYDNASKYNKIANCEFNNSGFDGIGFISCSFATVTNSVLNGNGHAGILISNGLNISIVSNIADTNQLVAITTGAYISVVGNTIANTTGGTGVGAINLSDSIISSNTIMNARFNGINMDGMRRCAVIGNVFINGGQATASTTAGIKLFRSSGSWESSNNMIIGNSMLDTQGTPTQDYGILEQNSSDNNTIAFNYLYGNITAALSLVGNNDIVYSNNGDSTVRNAPGTSVNVATKTSAYTITATNDVILADATTAGFTVSLPTAVGATKAYTIKKTDSTANAVTISGTLSQTIDGSTTAVLSRQYESITVVSNNANWLII